jgi:hypothetical protein
MFLVLLLIILFIVGCEKFVTVGPPKTQITTAQVFKDDNSANLAINGIYSSLISTGFASGDLSSIGFLSGLSADELINFNGSSDQGGFYTNNLIPTNGTLTNSLWSGMYSIIYDANAVIEGLAASSGVTQETKQELTGEAHFIRAMCAFYLVNLFGNVPIPITTDYRANNSLSRPPYRVIYEQIISDMKEAQNELLPDFDQFGGERIRPTKWAATAMLARIYLYEKNWNDAEIQSTALINNPTLFSLDENLDDVFLTNSSEAIWQLKPVEPTLNTNEGNIFILVSTPTEVTLNPSLVYSFEPSDLRRTHWIDVFVSGTDSFYFPFKYKVQAAPTLTEYSMVLRLAEQYLIRAEARVQQDRIADGSADLNIIRARAGLSNTIANNKKDLLLAIETERKHELFTEWGHRWLDLKRAGDIDAVLSLEKPGWQSSDSLYPIPQIQLSNDPNFSQNFGY